MPSFSRSCCIVLTTWALCSSCKPQEVDSASPGYDYFPLETGHYVIYEVEERRYALATTPTQQVYQLKEVVGDPYTDVTGQTAYRLIRYRRHSENQGWQPDSVWSARQFGNEAIRTENGHDFVKLIFPLSDQQRWNGNRRNTLGEDEYELRNNNQPYGVLDKQFGETVTVVAQDDSTLIAQDKRIDVYARQVGLIYKERAQVQYCSSSPDCVGKAKIDYGIQQIYRLQAYGTE